MNVYTMHILEHPENKTGKFILKEKKPRRTEPYTGRC